MMRRMAMFSAAAALLCLSAAALADEKHGVQVYPGATYDAATTKAVSEGMGIDAACYRTADAVAKVKAFYEKQPGMVYVGGDAENAMLRKGTVDVTVQRPWMDMSTGKLNKDTLISIVKTSE